MADIFGYFSQRKSFAYKQENGPNVIKVSLALPTFTKAFYKELTKSGTNLKVIFI